MNINYNLDCEIYEERYEEFMTLLEECGEDENR